MSGLSLTWAAASDTGLVRSNNEDAALAEDGLFAVADGMGGHAAGEVASRVAIETLQAHAGDGLVEAVRLANRAVWDRATENDAMRGMGTTICAVALVDEGRRLDVINVGDSRVYLLRDGDLQQVTDDHSLVADLEREGRLTADEAKIHPQRNIVTRVLGIEPDVEVDQFPVDPYRGDRLLLCSDGLFDEVDDAGIADILRRDTDPEQAAKELVRRARESGGRDNITVVVVDVVDDGGKGREASASLAGSIPTARAPLTSTVAPQLSSDDDQVVRAGAARTGGSELGRRSTVTWRSALFVLAVLAVIAAAVVSTVWFARNTFYVGTDGGEVIIFRGRPGGVLWLEPTIEEKTGLDIDDVPAARRADVEAGKEQSSLDQARRYVDNLEDQAASESSPRTTTTTSPPVTITAP